MIAIGFGVLISATAPAGENRIFFTMAGLQFAMVLVLVMASIAVTSEYRFGTVRTTFQATADRAKVLWTKAAMVGVLAFVMGEVIAFATFFLARLVANDDVLRLSTMDDWRMVAGHGVVYGIGAIIGVGVGALVRQTAGAISLLLVWTLLVESLVALIPSVGQDIARWLPFNNGNALRRRPRGVRRHGAAGHRRLARRLRRRCAGDHARRDRRRSPARRLTQNDHVH